MHTLDLVHVRETTAANDHLHGWSVFTGCPVSEAGKDFPDRFVIVMLANEDADLMRGLLAAALAITVITPELDLSMENIRGKLVECAVVYPVAIGYVIE